MVSGECTGKVERLSLTIKAASLFLRQNSPSIPSALTAAALSSFSYVLSSPALSLLTFLIRSLLPSLFLALCNNYRLPDISAHPFPSSAAAVQHTLLTFAFCAVGRAMEIQKLRHPKHLSAPSSMSPEPQDPAKLRQSGVANEGTDTGYLPASSMSSATSGAALSQEGGRENDTGEP